MKRRRSFLPTFSVTFQITEKINTTGIQYPRPSISAHSHSASWRMSIYLKIKNLTCGQCGSSLSQKDNYQLTFKKPWTIHFSEPIACSDLIWEVQRGRGERAGKWRWNIRARKEGRKVAALRSPAVAAVMFPAAKNPTLAASIKIQMRSFFRRRYETS